MPAIQEQIPIQNFRTDSVLSALVSDFRQAVMELHHTEAADIERVAADLCEASREILLSLGPPEFSDQRMLADISDLFRVCAATIDGLVSADSDSARLAANIRLRAGDIGF